MNLLYVFPEEWTGRRAREVHTLKTCAALAGAGVGVCLVTAGGKKDLAEGILRADEFPAGLTVAPLSRRIGPMKSSLIFGWHLRRWLKDRPAFDVVYCIHLKAARILNRIHVPYWWEAHEIFSETPSRGSKKEKQLSDMEKSVIANAAGRIATSQALADALNKLYFPSPKPFHIVPNAGDHPLKNSVTDPKGPLVYCGSLAEWKGLPVVLEAAGGLDLPVRIVGGTKKEWNELAARHLSDRARKGIDWKPRVDSYLLPQMISGCRAGLVPTLPETGSGRYSCPMKLFDYARCGLPVVTSALPALASLNVGRWCRQVKENSAQAWQQALTEHPLDGAQALQWAAEFTWSKRAERILRAFSG